MIFSGFSVFLQKSLICLIFPDPLTNSLTFPVFPDRLETLPLGGNSEGQKPMEIS